MARVWNTGLGGQCSREKKDGDYCATHAPKQTHGRIDEEIPEAKKSSFKKPRLSFPVLPQQAQLPVLKLRGQMDPDMAALCDGEVVRAVAARLREADKYEHEMAQAKRLSLDLGEEAAKQQQVRMQLLEQRLHRHGLARVPVAGDGNCQFRAVCIAFGFPVETHDELREHVCIYLEQHAEQFRAFQVDGSWDKYIKGLRGRAWGDHVTLMVMARMFHSRITMVSDSATAGEDGKLAQDWPEDLRGAPEVVIAHHGELHYEATIGL